MRNKFFKLFVGCTLLLLPFVALNAAQAETPAEIEDTSAVGELAYWNKIKASEDPAALKLYLDTFPQGMFYDLALSKYLAAGGSPSKLDTPAVASTPKVEEAPDEPEEEVVVEKPVKKTYTPAIKVQKRKQAIFKPKSDYRKIQKARYAIKKRAAKRYEPVVVYKRPTIKKRAAKRYEPVVVYKRPTVKKRIACAGSWRNGSCVVKTKYAKVRVKYVKPKYQAPPKPKKVYDNMNDGGSQGSGGGGGGGGWGG